MKRVRIFFALHTRVTFVPIRRSSTAGDRLALSLVPLPRPLPVRSPSLPRPYQQNARLILPFQNTSMQRPSTATSTTCAPVAYQYVERGFAAFAGFMHTKRGSSDKARRLYELSVQVCTRQNIHRFISASRGRRRALFSHFVCVCARAALLCELLCIGCSTYACSADRTQRWADAAQRCDLFEIGMQGP